MTDLIEIDGSAGEGGGQVLRTALALSVVTGKPFKMYNIRARRKNPGLSPQHLAGVAAAAQLCDAAVRGASVRSQVIVFEPASMPKHGNYQFSITELAKVPSAGSVTLLLQAILLPLAMSNGNSSLILQGGTHVSWSPPAHYVMWVLLPMLKRMGLHTTFHINGYGWYPEGGGEVQISIDGRTKLRGIDLTERGDLKRLQGVGLACNLPSDIPQRMTSRANNLLKEADLPPRIQSIREKAHSTGAGVWLCAEYENAAAGFGKLGRKGLPSDAVAEEAVRPFVSYHNDPYALDKHLPDQLLPFMVLADGASVMTTVEITEHTLTNINTIGYFIDREIYIGEGALAQPGTIYVS